jgi:hypothetical protein
MTFEARHVHVFPSSRISSVPKPPVLSKKGAK